MDSLDKGLVEEGRTADYRRTAARDILRELVTRTQDLPDMLEILQTDLSGHVTRITEELEA